MSVLYTYYVKNIDLPQGIEWLTCLWDVGRGNGHPVGMVMWFVKSLIVFSLLSPLYFVLIRYFKGFTIVVILLLSTIGTDRIDYPFFNIYLLLGSYLGIMSISFESLTDKLNWRFCLALFLIMKLVQIYIPLPDYYHYISEAACIIGLLGLFMRYPIKQSIAVVSTFVYFSHPYFTGIRNIFFKFVPHDNMLAISLMWILTASIIFVFCSTVFIVLKKYSPRVLAFMSGDRI